MLSFKTKNQNQELEQFKKRNKIKKENITNLSNICNYIGKEWIYMYLIKHFGWFYFISKVVLIIHTYTQT